MNGGSARRPSAPGPRLALTLALAIGAPALPGTAQAQDVLLPVEDYGKVVLPMRQSIGSSVKAITSAGNAFEPVHSLREDEPIRAVTAGLGRLDMIIEKDGKRFYSFCTATVIDRTHVLTNNHCVPGKQGKVVRASLLLNYLHADSKTYRLPVDTAVVATDAELDWSLVKLGENADRTVVDALPMMRFEPRAARPNERLTVVHHPGGQRKMMTQYRCRVAPSQKEEPWLRHQCDTLPGSSGSLIFTSAQTVLGIHHSGGMTQNDPLSFNLGTQVAAIPQLAEIGGDDAAASAASQSGDADAAKADTAATATDQADTVGEIIEAPSDEAKPKGGADGVNAIISGSN